MKLKKSQTTENLQTTQQKIHDAVQKIILHKDLFIYAFDHQRIIPDLNAIWTEELRQVDQFVELRRQGKEVPIIQPSNVSEMFIDVSTLFTKKIIQPRVIKALKPILEAFFKQRDSIKPADTIEETLTHFFCKHKNIRKSINQLEPISMKAFLTFLEMSRYHEMSLQDQIESQNSWQQKKQMSSAQLLKIDSSSINKIKEYGMTPPLKRVSLPTNQNYGVPVPLEETTTTNYTAVIINAEPKISARFQPIVTSEDTHYQFIPNAASGDIQPADVGLVKNKDYGITPQFDNKNRHDNTSDKETKVDTAQNMLAPTIEKKSPPLKRTITRHLSIFTKLSKNNSLASAEIKPKKNFTSK